MYIGKLIIIVVILFIVASCIPVGNYKFNPALTIIKMFNKSNNNNINQLGTRG